MITTFNRIGIDIGKENLDSVHGTTTTNKILTCSNTIAKVFSRLNQNINHKFRVMYFNHIVRSSHFHGCDAWRLVQKKYQLTIPLHLRFVVHADIQRF